MGRLSRTGGRCAAAALLLALGAAAPARAAPGPFPRVASVELRLPPGEDRRALADLVALAPGDALTPRAARRTVQRLFQTGRFRNVLVRASPSEGDAVAVVVECLPLRVVGAVRIEVAGPARPLDEARLLAAARLQAGEPFDAPDLERARRGVLDALARKGWRAARADASAEGDAQVAVTIRVDPGAPTRVAALRLAGDAAPAAALVDRLRTRPGDPLDEDVLAEDVRTLRDRLWRAGYRRARVAPPRVRDGADGAEVELAVEAGPLVAVRVRGSEAISEATLAAHLGIDEGEPLDLPAIDAAAERLRAFYRARGFALARIGTSERAAAGRVTVVFDVDEGRTYRVRALRVEGAGARGEADLRARLRAALDADGGEPPEAPEEDRGRELRLSLPSVRPPPTPPPALRPSEVWDEAAWDRAAQRVVDEYRADGWLEAAYLGGSVVLDARGGTADVTVRLREGPRRFVDSISFEGNEAVPLADLAREARLAPGEPLVFEKVEATRIALLKLYLSRGHAYARVETRADPDPARDTTAIRYLIDEGPAVHVGRILVVGNRRTREDVVLRAIALGEGDLYRPDAVARSQAALLRLGVFRSVGLRLQEPEAPDATKDVAVEVVERPWQTLSSGAGFSIANGPRAFVEYQRPNLLGRALELSARAKVNYPLDRFRPDLAGLPPRDHIEGRVEVGLRQPRIEQPPVPLALRVNAVAERVHPKAYDLDRISGIAGIDADLGSRATASLQYELEVDDIARKTTAGALSREDLERLRFGSGVTTLSSIRPSLALDHRDNAVHPRSGWFATAAAEFTHSLGSKGEKVLGVLPGSEYYTNMLKLATTVSGYLPVGSATVIALSARGGRVVSLDDRSVTPVPKRFFLGGASTMRGYTEDEMIPEDVRPVLREAALACLAAPDAPTCTATGKSLVAGTQPVSQGAQIFLLLKGELRVRVRGNLEGAIFADVGNLWFSTAAWRLVDLRWNLGVGIRFVTPIGPAALDFGFNLDPDPLLNEPQWAPHFAIGLF